MMHVLPVDHPEEAAESNRCSIEHLKETEDVSKVLEKPALANKWRSSCEPLIHDWETVQDSVIHSTVLQDASAAEKIDGPTVVSSQGLKIIKNGIKSAPLCSHVSNAALMLRKATPTSSLWALPTSPKEGSSLSSWVFSTGIHQMSLVHNKWQAKQLTQDPRLPYEPQGSCHYCGSMRSPPQMR